MDKEVELILSKLKIVSEEQERGLYLCDKEHSKLLLDYITNLQQQLHQASLDIQELTERDIECPSWCDKLTNLQKENAELKKKNDSLGETNLRINGDLKVAKQDRIEYSNELEDYKSRCEKADWYLLESLECLYHGANFTFDELIHNTSDILNGRSDE